MKASFTFKFRGVVGCFSQLPTQTMEVFYRTFIVSFILQLKMSQNNCTLKRQSRFGLVFHTCSKLLQEPPSETHPPSELFLPTPYSSFWLLLSHSRLNRQKQLLKPYSKPKGETFPSFRFPSPDRFGQMLSFAHSSSLLQGSSQMLFAAPSVQKAT